MKSLITLTAIFLFSLNTSAQPSIWEITTGTTFEVQTNADFCVDSIRNLGGTLIFNGTRCGLLLAPSLILPANNSFVTQPITFRWSSVSGAIRYNIQISTDSLFNTIVLNDTTLTDTTRVVTGLTGNIWHFWRVRARNATGWGYWSIMWRFNPYAVGMLSSTGEIPKEFRLYGNYPNPFNPLTTLKFDIPKLSYVKITVYDILGREISGLVNQSLEAGRYMLNFDASGLSSGTYFYRIEAGDPSGGSGQLFVNVKKMVVIK
jgi:hypothetical protein